MAKEKAIPVDQNIISLPFEEAMPDNYLPYAVEVAKDRALPDIRDGLKPVHRKILYGAYLLKAFPDRPYLKSARIVGDILGKFHPHGDSSVYDAMTILAQDFSTREPLMDGHGNWGSIDGDSAAAMRYTEARLSKQAMLMLKDIDMDTVDYQNNYSDTEIEPVVLPSKFPNLLVNGTFGIAVGLATNIPPHNLGEIIDATCALIKKPNLSVDDLMEYVKGPDLPTGGILIGKDAIKKAYETGEGKVTLRAKTEIEKLPNGRFGIVIHEFPYRKNKARLLQTISEMTGDKKHQKVLELISDIRDESDRNGIRAVVELKKAASEKQADLILKYLLKKTDLQSNLSFNMVAIKNGKPGTFSLKDILEAYVEHQKEVITRRTKKELDASKKRFHIVEGFIKAIDVLDELIKTIRQSKNKQDSINNIIEKFAFTVEQATAIVELMLYRLTGLEIEVFQVEHDKLLKTIERLETILNSESELKKVIIKELTDIKKEFSNDRRTLILDSTDEAQIDTNELIVVEDSMITLSSEGFIKKVPMKSYNRSTSDIDTIELRELDKIACIFKTNTLDNVLVFTNLGNMYQFKSIKIPELKWKEKGVRFDEFFKGAALGENERVVSAFSLKEITETMNFKFITDKGGIKRTAGYNFNTNYSKIVSLKLKKDEELYGVIIEDNRSLFDNKINKMVDLSKNENKVQELNALYGEDNPIHHENFLGEIEEETVYEEPMQELLIEEFNELPLFMKVTTEKGLTFTVTEPECEIKEKMVLSEKFCTIAENDRIVSLEYEKDFEIKNCSLLINKKNEIIPIDKKAKNIIATLNGDSNSHIVFISSNGYAYKMPGYLFENISGPISLTELFNLKKGKENIIAAFALTNDITEDAEVILASSNGLIKRLMISEFLQDFDKTLVYKFKNPTDKVVYGEFVDGEPKEDIFLLTEKGMAIKFPANSISVLGKVASGITGISLKDYDTVIFGILAKENTTLIAKTNKNQSKTIDIKNVKQQNRAGKGTNVVIAVLDEVINDVEVK